MTTLLRMLSSETGLSHEDLQRIIRTAPSRYKVFTIKKRAGGTREIAQPARELKVLQRVLIAKILDRLPIHEAATAYRRHRSIRDNASPHSGHGPILKMDFKDFFPSIRSEDWKFYCEKHEVLTSEDAAISSLILFRRARGERLLKLSIGAPSSPSLSNVLMYEFDEIVTKEAVRRGIAYTRYADDLTFSGQRIGMLRDMIHVVEKATHALTHPKLRVNDQKTTFVTTKFRRTVTGVILTNDGLLSLGRDRKRKLSAQVHRASLNQLSPEQLQILAGYLAFANVIEPTFLDRLARRYGADVVKTIQEAAQVPAPSGPVEDID
ncbi:MAG: retron St85 family RNA-directed DNA polymerase [Methyloceanibacter sp.]|uniref:retron St85 family RNA-directed DNA polymerase n=1 Tax=Methyloceanibacter sp. TaxID=1965321 RepID=UPI003D6C931F